MHNPNKRILQECGSLKIWFIACAAILLATIPAFAVDRWTLDVPMGVSNGTPDTLKGVLISWGSQVFQATDFGLQETQDGKVALAWLNGYDKDGNTITVQRELCGGGIALGRLGMTQVRLAADLRGFLAVGSPNEPTLSEPTYPCGMSHETICVARSCSSLDCGSPPNCACAQTGGGGSCDIRSRDWCDGTCASGLGQCNQAVNDCRCGVGPSLPPIDPPGSTMAPKPPKAPKTPAPKVEIQQGGGS